MSAATVPQRGLAATATLVHDFTLADVDRAARTAVKKDTWAKGWISDEERQEVAWFSVVEYLYDCSCGAGSRTCVEFTFLDLLKAASAGLGKASNEARSRSGKLKDGTDELSPNFMKFWLPVMRQKHRTDDGFSNQLCNRMVLREALAALNPQQYEVIAALAAYDSGPKAAEALGLNYFTYATRLRKARQIMTEVWLTGDDAPPPKTNTCKRGHDREKYGQQVERKGRLTWQCDECKRITDRRLKAKMRMDRRYEAETAS